MDRRTFLRAGAGLAASTAVGGCLSDAFETRPAQPAVLDDRPDAVYNPTHVEGMRMVDTRTAGPYEVTLSYSYPHRFWLVTGRNRRRVDLRQEDSVHLMATVRDRETGIVPPNGNLTFEIARDGETVAEKSMWPMLSQNMGFHFGDNVALDGDGTYEVTADIGPMDVRRTGAFGERFGDPASATFAFEFSRAERDDISFETLDDRQGERGAVEPMEMMPVARLPPAGELPGDVVGEGTSGDGTLVATALEEPPAGIEASGTYLAVSARTPYNRYPLPFMSLSATVARDGGAVFDGELTPTLDPDLDYHYGAAVGDMASGDALTLGVDAPPQVARHEGYETAFVGMDDVELTVA